MVAALYRRVGGTLLAGALVLTACGGPLSAQSDEESSLAEPAAAPSAAARIGLIDMAYVFQNYRKFAALRDDVKAEIEQTDREAQRMARSIQQLQTALKELGNGGEEYRDAERQLIRMTADFEAFRKTNQKELLQQEAALYKEIYVEVTEEVARYADDNGFRLVLRFNRRRLNDVQDPQQVMQLMNKQVVFFRERDDITEAVLERLNERFVSEVK